MAKSFKEKKDLKLLVSETVSDIKKKRFRPVYLICGDEPYYGDLIVDALLENVLAPQEKDFNLVTVYGNNVTGGQIDNLARKFPMFAEHQLIIVKEAQSITKLDQLEHYLLNPQYETVLVLFYSSGGPDKRTNVYKALKKNALVFESEPVAENEVESWVRDYLVSRQLTMDNEAMQLFTSSVNLSLRTIMLELEKLVKALPDKSSEITVKMVEENIGVSREYNVFQLNNALLSRDQTKSLKIAMFLGQNSKKYPIQANLGGMFYTFYSIVKYYAYERDKSRLNLEKKPFMPYQYQQAVRNYSAQSLLRIIALLKEYDYKSKSNDSGAATDGELLTELVLKILSLR